MKIHKYVGFILLLFIVLTVSSCVFSKGITLKDKIFEVQVNQEMSKLASRYFDNYEGEEEIVFRKSNINIKKIGQYDAKIAFKDKEYDIKLVVKDKEKPIVTLKNSLLVIASDKKLESVNELIDKDVMITDNYDINFPKLSILKELPNAEKEMIFPLQAKDSSGNLSKVVELHIQFTHDGKQKKGLLRENISPIVIEID